MAVVLATFFNISGALQIFITQIKWCRTYLIFMIHYNTMYHSMAKDNLNESKETTPTTTTALKVVPSSKSTSKCEDFE